MAVPTLSIAVEPLVGGNATYLPLVAASPNEQPRGKIVLRLVITNTGSSPVTMTGIAYAFPGSSIAPIMMQGVSQFFSAYYKDAGGAMLAAGQAKTWTNGLINLVPDDNTSQVNNAIFLAEPIPSSIQAQVTCSSFSSPATITLPLVPHKSSAAPGSYLFPYHATNLRIGEYYTGAGVHWANGGANGTQIFAHDLGCEAFDVATANWSRLLPGKSGSANADYRIYGKPIRALAAGTVDTWFDGMDENTVLLKFPDPTPSPNTGNSITILHGDEKVVYCHMQKGSIPAALKAGGAAVQAAQIIGLVGNTGNSSEPHTHIEAVGKAGSRPLRPLPFHDAYALAESALNPPDPNGAWAKLSGRGLPKNRVAVWPAATPPAWYPPGWGEVTHFGVPAGSYQTTFDHATASGYRPVWLDGYEVQGNTFFNVIFHPSAGAWIAKHALNATQYQDEFTAATNAGYRLTNLTSYVGGGAVLYAAIFDKVAGPAWRAYHALGGADHQQRFDAWTKEGYRPVNVSMTARGGVALFAAFYVQQDVGTFVHLGGLTSSEYQTAWTTQTGAGRRLAYLNAYQDGAGARFSAIFQEKTPGSGGTVGRHDLTAQQFQTEYDKQLGAGLATRAVVGYEVQGAARLAGMWRAP